MFNQTKYYIEISHLGLTYLEDEERYDVCFTFYMITRALHIGMGMFGARSRKPDVSFPTNIVFLLILRKNVSYNIKLSFALWRKKVKWISFSNNHCECNQ